MPNWSRASNRDNRANHCVDAALRPSRTESACKVTNLDAESQRDAKKAQRTVPSSRCCPCSATQHLCVENTLYKQAIGNRRGDEHASGKPGGLAAGPIQVGCRGARTEVAPGARPGAVRARVTFVHAAPFATPVESKAMEIAPFRFFAHAGAPQIVGTSLDSGQEYLATSAACAGDALARNLGYASPNTTIAPTHHPC